jgi:hypothetical protein
MQHKKINDQYYKLDRLVYNPGTSIFDAFVLANEIFPVVKFNKQDA